MISASILYVEDNDDLREAVSLMLEAEGREIVSCASGEEALRHCEARQFDVLISDVTLPGITGVELAQRLLADRPGQQVVICSGYGASPGLAEMGPNVRWLIKPFDMDDIEKLLSEFASRASRP